MKTKSVPSPSATQTGRLESASRRISARPPVGQPIPHYDEISTRARVLWLEKGCPAGHDEEIWLLAERQLMQPAGASGTQEPKAFIDQDGNVVGKVEASLAQIASTPSARSATSL